MPIDVENDTLKLAMQKLKAKENSFRQLEAISKMGSWEVNLKTHKSIWSDQSYKIYGLDKETTTPTFELFFSHILSQDLDSAKLKLQEAIATGKVTTFTCRLKKENGSIVTLLMNGQVIYDENTKPIKLIGTTQDITEQIHLKRRADELATLIEHSSNEIYIANFETLDYVYINHGASRAMGYSKHEFLNLNIRDTNPLLSEDEIKRLKKQHSQAGYVLTRTIHQRKDGTQYHVHAYIQKISYEGQECIVIFDTDISNIIKLEEKQKKQAKILNDIHDSVISTNIQGKIMSWNRGSFLLFGYTEEEMLDTSIKKLYAQENEYKLETLFSLLHEKNNIEVEAFMLTKDQTQITCDISLSTSRNEYGEVYGYVGYIQDITRQKQIQHLLEKQRQKLAYLAHHDTLTDLPNRTLFKDRLSQAIVLAKRNKQKFALLFIDLDQFKQINDSLGHDIGDAVLIQASKRFKGCIREEDTLARLGGDEFTIILKNIHSTHDISYITDKILNIIKEPITISMHNLYVTSSIGISIYPDDTTSDVNLIKYADVAMYKAKEEGRNNYQFYTPEMTAFAFERVVMESNIRIAIKEEQFEVFFQPQIDIQTEELVGMEALIRWRHPSLGLIAPDKFIPLAEETGLIIEIDRLVMQQAMQIFSNWYKSGLNPGVLSLNLAMKQLKEDDFITYLLETMHNANFQASWLELEVTEGQVMKNTLLSIEKLNTIHELNIDIAIDDFGTGYSSLSYLKKLPLDKLKIDKSFVDDIPKNEDDVAITKAIIALGKSLNFTLIAEGVETSEQKDFLQNEGCDLIQGYFFSKPLASQEMQKFLHSMQT